MKALFFGSIVCCAAMIFGSCGNEPDEYGSSTNIDSTNQNGTAPAQYGGGAPAIPDSSQYQDTRQIMNNIDSSNAGSNSRGPEPGPAGNGTNTSNTTDRRTTSGSANNGDADGDRKK